MEKNKTNNNLNQQKAKAKEEQKVQVAEKLHLDDKTSKEATDLQQNYCSLISKDFDAAMEVLFEEKDITEVKKKNTKDKGNNLAD